MKNVKHLKSISGLLVLAFLITGATATKALTTQSNDNEFINEDQFTEFIEYDDFTRSLIDKGVITEHDFETLSQAQIDQKLRNSGIDIEPTNTRDPLYNLTPTEIENLSDEQWTQIEKTLTEIYGEDVFDENTFDEATKNTDELSENELNEYMDKINAIITEKDWETLSGAQIDQKLRHAGIDVEPTDPRDPIYNLTPTEIEKLSDEQWVKIEKTLIEIYGDEAVETIDYTEIDDETQTFFEEKINSIITPQDWETLSGAQIDQKLRNAGIEIEPTDPRDPIHNLTPTEMQAIPDEKWETINRTLLELYGTDYFNE